MAYNVTPVMFFSGGGPTHIYLASDAHTQASLAYSLWEENALHLHLCI